MTRSLGTMPESAMRAPIAENAMEVAKMDESEGNGLYYVRFIKNYS